jgi:hypothetical protein
MNSLFKSANIINRNKTSLQFIKKTIGYFNYSTINKYRPLYSTKIQMTNGLLKVNKMNFSKDNKPEKNENEKDEQDAKQAKDHKKGKEEEKSNNDPNDNNNNEEDPKGLILFI